MRPISLLPWLAMAATALAANPVVISARGHLSTPQRTDCPYPWCEQTPQLYRLSAPDDPALYLADRISYERASDWRHFAPLTDEVATLCQGAATDMDKVTAIANWVKRSKSPGDHIYESWPPSIVDIWGFPAIRCDEASLLLTAMLRLAGVPAMRFVTWNNDHAAVRAFADSDWVVTDATPTEPDNSGPARLWAANDPTVIPAYQERPLFALTDVAVPGSSTDVDAFTLLSYEPVDVPAKLAAIGLAYARVAFPVTNEFLYYDPETHLIASSANLDQRVVIEFHIDAVDGGCLGGRGSWYATPIQYLTPGLLWRTIQNGAPSSVGQFYPLGYVETILPTCGTWRITYAFSSDQLNAAPSALAYADVGLDHASEVVIVRPSMLVPLPGADLYAFQTLVDTLAKLPSFEQLGGTTGN